MFTILKYKLINLFQSIVHHRQLPFNYEISKYIFVAFLTSDSNCRFQNGIFFILIIHYKNTFLKNTKNVFLYAYKIKVAQ